MNLEPNEKKCKKHGCDLPALNKRAVCVRHDMKLDVVGVKERGWYRDSQDLLVPRKLGGRVYPHQGQD